MAVTNKKIPIFNDTFDVSKISQVLKKNIIYYILIAIIAATSGFVYLRYTSPVYEAYTVLQVNEEQNQSFVNVENVYGNTSIPKLIELLRAFEFLKRTITKLNLTTSYYLEGKFLETELYKNAPFFVETENFPNNYKNSKIYVSYDNETGDIILNLNEKEKKDAGIRIKRNTWTNFFGGKIYINITNLENLKAKLLYISSPSSLLLFFSISVSFKTESSCITIVCISSHSKSSLSGFLLKCLMENSKPILYLSLSNLCFLGVIFKIILGKSK